MNGPSSEESRAWAALVLLLAQQHQQQQQMLMLLLATTLRREGLDATQIAALQHSGAEDALSMLLRSGTGAELDRSVWRSPNTLRMDRPLAITTGRRDALAPNAQRPTGGSALRRLLEALIVALAVALIVRIAGLDPLRWASIGTTGGASHASTQAIARLASDSAPAAAPIDRAAMMPRYAPIPLRAPPSITRDQYLWALRQMRAPLAEEPAAASAVYDELVRQGIDPAVHVAFAVVDSNEAGDDAFPPPRGQYNLHNLRSCPTCESLKFTDYVAAVRAWITVIDQTLPPNPPSVQTIEGLVHLQCQQSHGCNHEVALGVMRSLVWATRTERR